MEGLLDQMYVIKERCMRDAVEAGEPALDVKDYLYRCTSAMARRYRELVPRLRIPFDNCQELRQGVSMMIEGLNFDMTEEMFLNRFG